ncbi:sigma-70 family RNA polymerase sigma factor [Nocardia sp. NBC_01499]|uniref:RNA polymerase sigma factor n=1 Tax=Nocardia sp. NBC_01499 TaxID=2903597 RepID=UPI0038665E19
MSITEIQVTPNSRPANSPKPDSPHMDPAEVLRRQNLVAACVQGSQAAWRALIDEYSPLVWSITRTFRMANYDREDVYQSTWANVVTHLGDLQSPERLTAWLATTTRRECLKQIKRNARDIPIGDSSTLETPDHEAEATVHQVFRRVAGAEVRDAFRRLPDRDQRLLGLLVSDSAPNYDSVSGQLGMPRGSIGPLRGRALARLRGLLPESALIWVA